MSFRLSPFIEVRNAQGLCDYLQSLSNADFRAASVAMGKAETWKELSQSEFWHFFATLATTNARAFLGTMLKAVTQRHRRQPLSWDDEALVGFLLHHATAIDKRKVVEALLPLMQQPEEAMPLLERTDWQTETLVGRAMLCFRIATPTTYYLLFHLLREVEDDRPLIRRFAVELIRKNEPMAYNLACMLRDYFALDELPGTFALNLPPYELSRLDQGFEAFAKILRR